jgi:hypothetical protein
MCLRQLIAVSAYVARHIAQQGQKIVLESGGHRSASDWGELPGGDCSGGSRIAGEGGGPINGDHKSDDNKQVYLLLAYKNACLACQWRMAKAVKRFAFGSCGGGIKDEKASNNLHAQ